MRAQKFSAVANAVAHSGGSGEKQMTRSDTQRRLLMGMDFERGEKGGDKSASVIETCRFELNPSSYVDLLNVYRTGLLYFCIVLFKTQGREQTWKRKRMSISLSLSFFPRFYFLCGRHQSPPPSFLPRSYPSNHPSPLPSSCSLFAATLVGRWEEERGKIFAFAAVVSLGRKKLARLQ